jgi:hypothetical protein
MNGNYHFSEGMSQADVISEKQAVSNELQITNYKILLIPGEVSAKS